MLYYLRSFYSKYPLIIPHPLKIIEKLLNLYKYYLPFAHFIKWTPIKQNQCPYLISMSVSIIYINTENPLKKITGYV